MLSQFIQHITGAANPASALKTVTAPALTTTSTAAPAPLSVTDSSAPALRTVKLIMVTAANNNKYYEMHETTSGTFTVSYGRVGGSVSTATYPMNLWDKKFREKVAKGYVDQTHLYADKPTTTSADSIADVQVRALMTKLMEYANQSIFQNYIVSAQQVTKQQVDTAQQLLNELAALTDMGLDIGRYNDALLNLFKTIPRKMGKVSQHLVQQSPQTSSDLQELRDYLAAEQDTLDVMRSQVELNQPKPDPNSPEAAAPSLLDALGLTVEPVTDDRVLTLIRRMMGSDAAKFDAAFSVQQTHTEASFTKHVATANNKKTQLLWHGSRSENWLSILKSGLVLRPTNAVITGKMFGYGIYFADQFSKSLNYTSLSGSVWAGGRQREAYLAIYEVHVGKQFVVNEHETWHYNLTGEVLQRRNPNLDSVYAQRGKSLLKNEFIVYNQNQNTIRYLVRVKL
ncbi:ADP-ribose polymerase [Fibrella aquatica]|uniref:ADP-ribose polymerase n=1 Tax=Fibrella aquatica TaxID=3242487 RepID=UPI00351FC658